MTGSQKERDAPRPDGGDPVRYAVVGLGHIAQVAVLPAFANAANSRLAGLVSGQEEKRRSLSARHGVDTAVAYEQYDDLLASGAVDAVYISLPNHMHADYTVRAAEAGVHVLCEKPMALDGAECRRMIDAAEANDVRLMIAYRLHFEAGNLAVADAVTRGRLGEPRSFHTRFTQDVSAGNVRLLPPERGGGPVYDMGIYCINAARYVFRSEPIRLLATTATREDPRFTECEEMASVVMTFPGERLATFTCSFGGGHESTFRVVGTRGSAEMDPAFGYATRLECRIQVDDEVWAHTLPKSDQFAPELMHFSDCVRSGRDPEPGGREGLNDVQIIRAIYESARAGRAVELELGDPGRRPSKEQARRSPSFPKPEEIHAAGPKER